MEYITINPNEIYTDRQYNLKIENVPNPIDTNFCDDDIIVAYNESRFDKRASQLDWTEIYNECKKEATPEEIMKRFERYHVERIAYLMFDYHTNRIEWKYPIFAYRGVNEICLIDGLHRVRAAKCLNLTHVEVSISENEEECYQARAKFDEGLKRDKT